MALSIQILGWESQGLRCPDHKVNCCDDNKYPYKVCLIQMPNGTGKTTTLELLRAALSGSLDSSHISKDGVREYKKKNGKDDFGKFQLSLLLGNKRVTIIINFDFQNGTIHYKTTRGKGQVEGFDPPTEFRRFMNKNFVDFYIFDGELAQNLLDKNHTDAEVAIEVLFQINLFDGVIRQVSDYWESKTSSATAKDTKGLNQRKNKRDSLQRRLNTLINERIQLLKKKEDLIAEINECEDIYIKEIEKGKELSEKLNAATTAVEQLESKLKNSSQLVLENMRDPYAITSVFAKSISELKTGLDRVKLPESAAREFFEELADEDTCVCGRAITDEIRDEIRKRAKRYLGSDDVSLLNSMKTSIHEAVGKSTDAPEGELKNKLDKLDDLVQKERLAINERDHLRQEAERTNPAVKEARENIDSLKNTLKGVKNDLDKFDSDDDSLPDERTYGIDVINSRFKEAEDRYAEIKGTIELKKCRDILLRILKTAHKKAKNGISKDLCDEANQRIMELLPDNAISIGNIEHCLSLDGQSGGSAGETLSVGYAFLSTLFNRAEHQLPFVVDSPAGPIDLAIRPKIGELIPKLGNQFIAFTISSERAGFISGLKKGAGDSIHFISLFRKGNNSLETSAKKSHTCHETTDGITVIGEEFFNDFQLEEEIE